MGRLVLPMGSEEQVLTVIDKDSEGQYLARQLIPVRFSKLEAAKARVPCRRRGCIFLREQFAVAIS